MTEDISDESGVVPSEIQKVPSAQRLMERTKQAME
jgi:hypothetical protein